VILGKAKKLKKAKDEANQEIEAFKKEREAKFQTFVDQVSCSGT